jgi:Acetyltransferase (GNAT) domain
MKIAALTARDEAVFNELALSHGSIFNTTRWTNIFGRGIRSCGIFNDGGDLMGGFIVYGETRFGLSVYRNPPFTPAIGPFLKMEASSPVAIMDTWKKVLAMMAEYISAMGFSVVSVALDKNVIDTQPFIWRKNKVVPEYTYVLDLTKDTENLMADMSPERRKNIRKGLKDGLLAGRVSDYGEIKMLVNRTFARQGRSVDQHYLDKILFEFADEGNSFAYSTSGNGKLLACSFCVYDRNTAYYLLGGYDNEGGHHGAGAMAMWEAIRHAKEKGLRYFDFEGSMIPQIETYFRGFGGRLTPYYRINKAKLPLEMALKLLKRRLF